MAWGGSKIDWTQEASGREKVYFIVLMLLVLYPFITMVWDPTMKNTRETKKEIDTVKMQVSTLEKMMAAQPQPTAAGQPVVQLPETPGADDPRFAPYMRGEIRAREEVMKEVVQRLTAPATLMGVQLMSFSFSQDKDEGNYLSVPFDLKINGPFMATMEYLQRIERLPMLVIFDQVSIYSPMENRADLQTALRGLLYVVKSPAALGAPGVAPGAAAPGTMPPAPAAGGHP